jgi:hypothetical protein
MAGGKETPRQKMIGMMYLVLTALLALNVSKQVLDAFCAIEENMQKAAMTHLDRGNQAIDDLKAELTDKTNPEKVKKVKKFIQQINKIDSETAKMIESIDKLKMLMIEKSGEKATEGKEDAADARKHIIWKKYDKKEPLRPARLNLLAISAKDQYDVPMEVMIGAGAEPNAPLKTGEGIKLWDDFNKYRLNLLALTATYKDGEKNFSCKPTGINDHKDNADLIKKVTAMFDKQKVNPEDKDELITLYCNLTKQEKVSASAEGDDNTKWHWVGKTWDHSPLVAAIASLTSMESEILAARAQAIRLIKAKITTGEYSFNKVAAIAAGPDMATSGDEVPLTVMMAAFDSDKQPEIRNLSGASVSEIKDGRATLKVNVSGGGEMRISGEIGIRKKSGDMKWEKWEKTIKVMASSGTVNLPEMMIMYRNYENVLEAVAAGYDKTNVRQSAGVLRKTGKGTGGGDLYTLSGLTAANKEVIISLTAQSSVTNKTANVGQFKFKVKTLPRPDVIWSWGAGATKVGYGPDIPLNSAKVKFAVSGWAMGIVGSTMKPFKGTGSTISPQALGVLKKLPKGSQVGLTVYFSSGGVRNEASKVFTK